VRHNASLLLSGIVIDRDSEVPLAVQLYDELRQAIVSGQLRRGARIPSTRALAADLEISRNTVAAAYDYLLGEGYIQSRSGAGSVVSSALPEDHLSSDPGDALSDGTNDNHLALRGVVLAEGADHVSPYEPPRPFVVGTPDVSEFPFDVWSRLLLKHWRSPLMRMVCSVDAAGYLKLREAITHYVGAARGLRCTPERVFVVSGSRQGLDMAVRLLVDRNDEVLMEDPGYPGARSAFEGAGARLYPLDIDEEGARVPDGRVKAKMAFLTPSHQYPLGMTMSLERRKKWLAWAESNSAWIIEDDFDSEFRYAGRPEPAMQGLDQSGRVIYLGTFSKTLLPSLRLGFVVLPECLVQPFRRARAVIDGFPPILEQAVLAEFIHDGHFGRHVRRMRMLYDERRLTLETEFAREMQGIIALDPCDTGIHVVGWLADGITEQDTIKAAAASGFHLRGLQPCRIRPAQRQGLLLGFAAAQPEELRRSVRILAPAMRRLESN
jgi:GntR family transcriptional regulator/MocR family aminotransferase